MSVGYPGANSYFDLIITNTSLNGTYDSWCVDAENGISLETIYTANVYSSYDAYFSYDLNDTQIDNPENMSMVNWVINQNFVGQTAEPNCSDNYTCGDVQQAIWVLLDDDPGAGNLAFACNNDSCRVNEIVTAAQSHGDFRPGCDDKIAIVLEPRSGAQVVIGEMLLSEVDVDHDDDGYTCGAGDCNDFDSSIPKTYYRDEDGDGYGDPLTNVTNCSAPSGYVENNEDCDDNNASINPDTIWYKDSDGNGYSDGTNKTQCERPSDYYLPTELNSTTGDCDDTDASVYPGAEEILDGKDNDCDGMIDETAVPGLSPIGLMALVGILGLVSVVMIRRR